MARLASSHLACSRAPITVRDCAFFTPRMAMHVIAFGDYDHATCFDTFHQRVGHLLGEALLQFADVGHTVHQSCKLA